MNRQIVNAFACANLVDIVGQQSKAYQAKQKKK